jgi:hypothetical protein
VLLYVAAAFVRVFFLLRRHFAPLRRPALAHSLVVAANRRHPLERRGLNAHASTIAPRSLYLKLTAVFSSCSSSFLFSTVFAVAMVKFAPLRPRLRQCAAKYLRTA